MLPVGPSVYERRPGDACRPLPLAYRRHEPEKTILYKVVQEHLASFLAEQRERSDHGFGLPRFVEREFEKYLDCGILCRGFARARCRRCGDDMVVAFSCRGRAICPSCGARRMHDGAAHLVDRVIPRVPVRQWVLTFPPRLRACLAYDSKLLAEALTLFIRALYCYQRCQARLLGLPTTRATTSGSITVVQRVGSALQTMPHFHTLLPDGVFTQDPKDPDGRPRFHRLEPPDDQATTEILQKVSASVLGHLRKKGRLDDDWAPPPDDALAPLFTEAVPVPARPRAPGPRVQIELDPEPRTASLQGFSLHAAVAVHDNDREGLERLCRYCLRPPLSLERLSLEPDGQLRYRLKRRFSDGSQEVLLSPQALLGRLAAAVPRPRVHGIHYHGLFAAHAHGRAALVGRRAAKGNVSSAASKPPPCAEVPAVSGQPPLPEAPPAHPVWPTAPGDGARDGHPPVPPPLTDRSRRLPWAELLRRVHKVDVETCKRCGGRVEIIAYITEPTTVSRILGHLDLPTEPPLRAPARAPPQLDLELGDPSEQYFADPPCADW